MVDAVLPRSVKIDILLSFTTFFSITTRLNDAIERTTLANLNGVNNQIKDSEKHDDLIADNDTPGECLNACAQDNEQGGDLGDGQGGTPGGEQGTDSIEEQGGELIGDQGGQAAGDMLCDSSDD